ncbi:Carboxypeptidase Y inhibitor [Lachnellula suecica]|uniref:Carboxypeptidase Y inhibitor n=1 Tax=Lachnellula suecica TaxID=602035 RepID=A0A8T9C2H1_9HELO|nr:Carboxypeptidase Y inhibitor [Lachnellula suecica]
MQLTILPTILLLTAAIPNVLAVPTDQAVLTPSKDSDFSKIKHALQKAEIIGDVLPDFTPKCYVLPSYSHGKKTKAVALGNKFKKSKTKKKPSLTVYCPNMKTTTGLTIALTDPDAPSRKNPKWGEMCHWIAPVSEAVSVAGEGEGVEFEVMGDSVDDLKKYKAPGPPEGTGYHRYVFVLLEGDNTNLTVPSDRQHWGTGKKGHGVRDWAEGQGLEVIGANYFIEK